MINEKIIEEVKKRLIHTYHPLAIYVFGSYAWGHPDEESDLDLLVVVDEHRKDRFKAMSDGYRALMDLEFSNDILLYSKEEFEERATDQTTLCHKVVTNGKKIYGKA